MSDDITYFGSATCTRSEVALMASSVRLLFFPGVLDSWAQNTEVNRRRRPYEILWKDENCISVDFLGLHVSEIVFQ